MFMGFLRWQNHAVLVPYFPGDRDKVTLTQNWGVGGEDLESCWFNSANTDQVPAVCPELCDAGEADGRTEREADLGQSWFLRYHMSRTNEALTSEIQRLLFQRLCSRG